MSKFCLEMEKAHLHQTTCHLFPIKYKNTPSFLNTELTRKRSLGGGGITWLTEMPQNFRSSSIQFKWDRYIKVYVLINEENHSSLVKIDIMYIIDDFLKNICI